MSVTETLIPAGAGLVVGLVPWLHSLRRERVKRDERERSERKRELEHQREQLTTAATRYLELLGQAMVLLEAIRVDADNADDLIQAATSAISELQGHAHADLLVTFGESSPAIWADRACRRLLTEALTIATEARSMRQTAEAARQTHDSLRRLTVAGVDPGHGPRDLVRWATVEAIRRWPEPLQRFEEPWLRDARDLADRIDLELPAQLVGTPDEPPPRSTDR